MRLGCVFSGPLAFGCVVQRVPKSSRLVTARPHRPGANPIPHFAAFAGRLAIGRIAYVADKPGATPRFEKCQ